MTSRTKSPTGPQSPLLHMRGATLALPSGRVLFEGLSLSLSREHVALVGRNGVGKSTLLAALSGAVPHERVRRAGRSHFVPQALGAGGSEHALLAPGRAAADASRFAAECRAAGLEASVPERPTNELSRGERKKLRLIEAKLLGAEILLLDEPTDDLDETGVAWLRGWLRAFHGCLLVVSHDRRLLQDFEHFFVARESGCRYFAGTLAELDAEQEREHKGGEARYLQNLHHLASQEARTLHVARRKARKKQFGRWRELKRATSRARLNQKRDDAQVSHGRLAQLREARIAAVRDWTKGTRRALEVRMPLALTVPVLPEHDGSPVLMLRDVSATAHDRTLFAGLDLAVVRERVAVVGPNGSGKTTLLETMLERRAPSGGRVRVDLAKVGAIAQGAADWMLGESLALQLHHEHPTKEPAELAKVVVAHRFPLALAERPLRSLSPGERVRAALICLFEREPACEVLVLDEPTYALDGPGRRALMEALAAWPGGLVVASHDEEFLEAVAFDRVVTLGDGSATATAGRASRGC